MLPLAPAPPRSLLPRAPTVSLSFNNTPRLPFLSLRLLMFHFSLFLYSSCLRSLCPIGIRVGDDISVLQVHPHHHGKSYSFPSPIPFSHALLYHWMCRKQERKRMARIRRKEMMDKRWKEEKKTARWSKEKTTNDDENVVQGEGADGWDALVLISQLTSATLGFLQVFIWCFYVCRSPHFLLFLWMKVSLYAPSLICLFFFNLYARCSLVLEMHLLADFH